MILRFKEMVENYKVSYTPGGANQNVLRVFQVSG